MNAKKRFREMFRNSKSSVLISVHRGLWGPLPENSLAAIRKAVPYGIVEIDIQLSSDGEPVVFHDDTLDRMTDHTGRVSEFTAKDISRIRLREGSGGSSKQVTSETVPLFSELLSDLPQGAFFDVDVKNPSETAAVAQYLEQKSSTLSGSIKIDTSTKDEISNLLALEDKSGLMGMAKVNLSTADLCHIADLRNAGIACAELWFDDIDKLAEAYRVAGDQMKISTYTLDPVHCCGLSDTLAKSSPNQVWGKLIEAGVGVIMTDQARQLSDYLNTL